MNIQLLTGGAVQQAHAVRAAEAVPAAEQSAQSARSAVPDYDEYIPEDRTGLEHSGLYRLVSGQDGPELRFDAPEDASPAAAADGGAPDRAAPEKPSGRKAEQTTTDTGRVDREIQKLRAEAERLDAQLRSAAPDEAERLQKRLSQVQAELRQKDNDSYRRAHAVVS